MCTNPPTLPHLAVFEDCEDDPLSTVRLIELNYERRLNDPLDDPSLGLVLAKTSRDSRHLAASVIIDARHFFEPFWMIESTHTGWAWSGQARELSSHIAALGSGKACKAGGCLICRLQAIAARRMPELSTTGIWNGKGDEHGCIFRYYGGTGSNIMTLQRTWLLSISDGLMERPKASILRSRYYLTFV